MTVVTNPVKVVLLIGIVCAHVCECAHAYVCASLLSLLTLYMRMTWECDRQGEGIVRECT